MPPVCYECDVCAEPFNEGLRLPKVLPCQHTYCMVCLAQMNDGGSITCPTDGKDFAVETAASLPDNLYVMSRIRRYSSDGESPSKRLRACSQGLAVPGNVARDEEDDSAASGDDGETEGDSKGAVKGAAKVDVKGDVKGDADDHGSKGDAEGDPDDDDVDVVGDSTDDEDGEVSASLQQQLLTRLSHRRAQLMTSLVEVQNGVVAALQDRVQAEGMLLQRTVALSETLAARPHDLLLRGEAAKLLRRGTAAVERDLQLVEARSAHLTVEGCWQSGPVALGQQPVLQLAALLLRQQASQSGKQRAAGAAAGAQEDKALKVLPLCPRVNVVNVTMRPVDEFKQEKQELLLSTIPIRVLTRVCCHPHLDPEFSLSLLWKHAPHLEEVHLYDASCAHLVAVHGMRALRRLQVRGVIAELLGSPNDAQSSTPQLPPLPPRAEGQERGLTWLQLVSVPRETAAALLAGNRLSLRKLRLAVGPPTTSSRRQGPLAVAVTEPAKAVWPFNCDDLEHFLGGCGLQVLESLTLVRSEPCPSSSWCEMQQTDALRALPANCRVRCSFCRIWVTGNY